MDALLLTEEMFMKLTKEQSWDLFKGLKEMVLKFDEINEKLAKIPALETRVDELEPSLLVSQNAMSLLQKELAKEKKSNIQRTQYGRLENAEISGIPAAVADDQLEQTVVDMAAAVGVQFKKRDIAACHRLRGARKDTIIRFPNRKHADALLSSAPKFKDIDLSNLLGKDHAPIYVNISLTPELRRMRWAAKCMKTAGLVERFGVTRRGVYVQAEVDGEKHPVFIDSDLECFLRDDVHLHVVLYGDESEAPAEV